jgi:plasmid stability protein
MPDIHLRNVPAEEYEALSTRAARLGRSCEDEIRQLLHHAAQEELLLRRLEQATQAVDARLASAERSLGTAKRAGRRYRRVEPTPRGKPQAP